MLKLVKPTFEDLSFRKELLADAATMSYNAKWGGVIDFSEDKWESWYRNWCGENESERFYRYLYSEDEGEYIGNIALSFDDEYQAYMCEVLVKAQFRGKGYGKEGLTLLCDEAAGRGISKICDNIAVDNPATELFFENGFVEAWRNEDFIMLEKTLKVQR